MTGQARHLAFVAAWREKNNKYLCPKNRQKFAPAAKTLTYSRTQTTS